MSKYVSDEQGDSIFRKIGFTDAAIDFPLSAYGQEIIAEHNGVTVGQLPEAARYSSNAYMHSWIEALGARKSKGLSTRHQTGRWLLLNEVAA